MNKEVRESRYNSVNEMRRHREERGDEETEEVGPFMNKKVIKIMIKVNSALSNLRAYCSMVQKYDTYKTPHKAHILGFGVPNVLYYSI